MPTTGVAGQALTSYARRRHGRKHVAYVPVYSVIMPRSTWTQQGSLPRTSTKTLLFI